MSNGIQIAGGFMTPYSGAASVTPGFATSTKIDLNQIGEARNSMLGIKLDQVSGLCVCVRAGILCDHK